MANKVEPAVGVDDSPITARSMGMGILIPLGGYYLLRLLGLDPFPALVITAGLSAVGTLRQVIRSRNLLSLDAAMLVFTIAAIGQGLIHGNPRFLLAIDSGLTAMGGLWFLLTARTNRPLGFVFFRILLEGRALSRRLRLRSDSWGTVWEQSPQFRHIWRVSTVVWGLGSIADALIRLIMAVTLPVDVVPGLNALLYPVTFVLLQIVTNTYYQRAGLWDILRASPAAQRAIPVSEQHQPSMRT